LAACGLEYLKAMERALRSALQRATQSARQLLEADYRDQLEGRFDVFLEGRVEEEAGRHLGPREKVQRERMVAAIEHLRRSGESAKAAIASFLRETAFTTLNRFVALRTLEARGLLEARECVAKGSDSVGFREYGALAPGLAALPDRGYRLFLESVLDELAVEVGVLFDRSDPHGLLWPRAQALEDLLSLLNDPELAPAWEDDEAIGWMYQYFNADTERKAMRKASGAPRDRWELAVRNQFFTPRYVVEFLVDNTLGRLWVEMRQGNSRLLRKCQYLVRLPGEVFLSRTTPAEGERRYEGAIRLAEWLLGDGSNDVPPFGEQDEQRTIDLAHVVDGYARHAPDAAEIWAAEREMLDDGDLAERPFQQLFDALFFLVRRHHFSDMAPLDALAHRIANEIRSRVLRARQLDLSNEERLRAPSFVRYRPKKDPREIRVLDPACGSGHFLLYAFNLLHDIYEEAWEDEELNGAHAGEPQGLRRDYDTLDLLRREIPELILRHNLHGIEIDPRAAQVAAFALWAKAQRTLAEHGFRNGDRPPIRRTNIVVAEPMPGDETLARSFADSLDTKLHAALFLKLREEMALAHELGPLLRLEHATAKEVDALRRSYDEEQRARTRDEGYLPSMAPIRRQGEIDFEGLSDPDAFFADAERQILGAFPRFLVEAAGAGAGTRRRLFADDAQQGLALLELLRQPFDVVLMNPPFGAATPKSKARFEALYPRSRHDLFAAFVERGLELLLPRGRLGAITSRTGFFLSSYEKWREEVVLGMARPVVFADLGTGVLDAMVEVAVYCLEREDAA
jgi:hypothetical protein